MEFRKKVFIIVSHESWGKMMMSKHHYAIELAKAGNKVYFVNHPDKRYELNRGEILLLPTDEKNVFEIKHRLFYPYFLKFRFKKLYNFFTDIHIRRIISKIGTYPDIAWSFDTSNTLPLKFFRKSRLRILMPVDGPFWHVDEKHSSDKADVIISVTDRILEVFNELSVPKFLVNHGVSDVFLKNGHNYKKNTPLCVGYSGSLVRNDLDTKTFLRLITEHPDINFEFWGETNPNKSNIHLPQDIKSETLEFLQRLESLHNVKLHGPVSSNVLANGISKMDILLVCYAIKNDQNHHKILEYLGTGNVIVSNFLSSYNDRRDLIEMTTDSESNDELPEIFERVVSNIENYNSPQLRQRRISYAQEHSYSKNIERIENFVNRTYLHAN